MLWDPSDHSCKSRLKTNKKTKNKIALAANWRRSWRGCPSLLRLRPNAREDILPSGPSTSRQNNTKNDLSEDSRGTEESSRMHLTVHKLTPHSLIYFNWWREQATFIEPAECEGSRFIMRRFGLAVKGWLGWWSGEIGSTPRFGSPFSSKVVAYRDSLVTFFMDTILWLCPSWNVKTALIPTHLNAGVTLVVTVALGKVSLHLQGFRSLQVPLRWQLGVWHVQRTTQMASGRSRHSNIPARVEMKYLNSEDCPPFLCLT